MSSLMGNPHSGSASSQLSSRRIEDVRHRVLRLFRANPDHFDVVFVANATAGIKLVMEAFREHDGGFWYGYHGDAHTSLVGVRENAAKGHKCFTTDEEVESWLSGQHEEVMKKSDLGLFTYPAQSNMNGRRLPIGWPNRLRSRSHSQQRRMYTLLDAAALVSTSPLDLSDASQAPDFTVLSFYKIFGFPDLGALIIRQESGPVMQNRKYFGGGTVEMVTCLKEQWYLRKEDNLHEQLEDGTLPIHNIIALDSALNVHEKLFHSIELISSHTSFLASNLYTRLSGLRHRNGSTVCTIYKGVSSSYENPRTQGPVIALNLQDSQGAWISNFEIEKLAAIKNIQFRSGGLCNPGGIASSLDLAPWEMKRNFSVGQRCGSENDILGGKPTGVIRVSFGAMSNMQDATTFVEFVEEFFVDNGEVPQRDPIASQTRSDFYVEKLTIYPIKSCGGWPIPPDIAWDIKPEGLAWDREWSLVHLSTHTALSQKRYPKMALLRPCIDLAAGLLRIHYNGSTPPSTPSEITVPLSADPIMFKFPGNPPSFSRVCGDTIHTHTYVSQAIATFFTNTIGTPCTLARYPASTTTGATTRHSKAHLQPHQTPYINTSTSITPTSSPPRPILLSNESPILTISRSSLNRLNESIKLTSGKAAHASVFRANIILAENPASPPGAEQPYIEDTWRHMRIGGNNDEQQQRPACYFEILGSCRRCQMVCVDQESGEKNEEPFVTLAKTRRFGGKVFFGQHTGLVGRGGRVRVGDRVVGFGEGEWEEGWLEGR